MLTTLDWLIIGGFLALSLAAGLWQSRRAARSTEDFFLGGRRLSWWLAGFSMVATTFAADTPLLVTELVRKNGISGNWLWWNMVIGGMLTVFLFARLWRRIGVTTDLEFVTRRYAGPAAAWLRGIKAVYFGLFINVIVIGWVCLAFLTLLEIYFPAWSEGTRLWVLGGSMTLILLYSASAGLLGVVITDAFQFVLAMTGSVILAWLVLSSEEVGGMAGLRSKLPDAAFEIFPRLQARDSGTALALTAGAFLTMIGVQWWAAWYPGNEPGGGGYIAQRMMATKNERHALGATFFFQLFHYAIRPWPWILVGLATAVLYPTLAPDSYREGYVMAMRDFLPPGLQGILLAAFFAAFMSTISTQFNWGVSYLINDLYRPYLRPGRRERHYVWAARGASALVFVLSLIVVAQMTTLEAAFKFLISSAAGLGFTLIVRWYWWRVSAISEITATVVPLLLFAAMEGIRGTYAEGAELPAWLQFPGDFLLITAANVLLSLLATLLWPEAQSDHLRAFYAAARPRGWWPAALRGEATPEGASLWVVLLAWIMGTLFVLSGIFVIGAMLTTGLRESIVFLALLIGSGGTLWRLGGRYQIFR